MSVAAFPRPAENLGSPPSPHRFNYRLTEGALGVHCCCQRAAGLSSILYMETRFLGRSGLRTSVLSFGTMTFGGQGRFEAMGSTQAEEAQRLVELCIDSGVNLFDTADIYSNGASEEILGRALGNKRKQVLVATKAFARMGMGPNELGLTRHHLIEACEESLKRLATDYIDLYQVHSFDSFTPLEETLRALDSLVRTGKVRYVGCSNYAGWQLMKAISVSERDGLEPYISQQINYSLLAREAEHELIPLALDQRLGVLVWSPLQFGLLSGKYRRGDSAPAGTRLNALEAPGTIDRERLHQIVGLLDEIAKAHNASTAQAALNWLKARPAVTSIIVGARTESQLRDNLAAAGWSLTPEELKRLDDASAVPLPYPYWHQQKYGAERNPGLEALAHRDWRSGL
jgi:aryl-alcohol dehydrogenase-like predicted oxidoreductase